jgi:Cholesterol oxidase, substrate-binding
VVSDFYAQYTSRLTYYQGLGQFPLNGPIEIRVTGLDQPSEVAVSGAQSPILSSVRPRPDTRSGTRPSGWTWARCR